MTTDPSLIKVIGLIAAAIVAIKQQADSSYVIKRLEAALAELHAIDRRGDD